MSANPSPALALARAFDHFEQSSARALNAAANPAEDDLVPALVDLGKAKVEVMASLAVLRFSDEMWKALLDIGREPRCRC